MAIQSMIMGAIIPEVLNGFQVHHDCLWYLLAKVVHQFFEFQLGQRLLPLLNTACEFIDTLTQCLSCYPSFVQGCCGVSPHILHCLYGQWMKVVPISFHLNS